MKKRLSIILTVAFVLEVIIIAYYGYSSLIPALNPLASPNEIVSPSYTPFYPKVTPNVDFALSEYSINITQGESFGLNVTVMSLLENETTTKSIAVQILGYNNSAWSLSEPQRIFNASLDMNPVVLGPYESKSFNMTMKIAEYAPLGKYVFAVGNVQLIVVVTPRVS
jgi:hypothetical protein